MALPPTELSKRIKAAAALHGWSMRQVRDELQTYGADRLLAERIASGKLPARQAALDTLASFFGLPVAWFEAEDWRPLISSGEAARPGLAEIQAGQNDLLAGLMGLGEAVESLRAELADAQSKPPQQGESRERPGNGRQHG